MLGETAVAGGKGALWDMLTDTTLLNGGVMVGRPEHRLRCRVLFRHS